MFITCITVALEGSMYSTLYTQRERVLPAPYATYPSFRPSILVFVLISISPQ